MSGPRVDCDHQRHGAGFWRRVVFVVVKAGRAERLAHFHRRGARPLARPEPLWQGRGLPRSLSVRAAHPAALGARGAGPRAALARAVGSCAPFTGHGAGAYRRSLAALRAVDLAGKYGLARAVRSGRRGLCRAVVLDRETAGDGPGAGGLYHPAARALSGAPGSGERPGVVALALAAGHRRAAPDDHRLRPQLGAVAHDLAGRSVGRAARVGAALGDVGLHRLRAADALSGVVLARARAGRRDATASENWLRAESRQLGVCVSVGASVDASLPATIGPYRNRIIGLRVMPVGALLDNPRNWRRHPDAQKSALDAVMRSLSQGNSIGRISLTQ